MVRLHHNYILNKINISITLIMIGMVCIFQLIIANPFSQTAYLSCEKIDLLNNYNFSSLVLTRMVIIFWSIYLFGFSFNKNGDNYSILLQPRVSRKTYFYSKVLSINLELLKLIVFLFCIYIWVGCLCTKWYTIQIRIISEYLKIYFLGLIYGYLSLFFMRIFKSIFSIMLITFSYIVSEILITENVNEHILNCIQLFLPVQTYNEGNGQLFYSIFHLLVLVILYLLLGSQVYCLKKE